MAYENIRKGFADFSSKLEIQLRKSELAVKLNDIFNKTKNKILNSRLFKKTHMNSTLLYAVSFLIFYICKLLMTTKIIDVPIFFLANIFLSLISVILIFLKIFLYDSDNKMKFLFAFFGCTFLGLAVIMLLPGYNTSDVMLYLLFIFGASQVDFRKIALPSSIFGAASILAITVSSQIGLLPDEIFDGTRHALGFLYPTEYAAHWFFVCLAYFYYRRGKLKWYENICFILTALFCLYACRAKLDSACIIFLVMLGGILRIKTTEKIFDKLKWLFVAVPLLSAGFSFGATYLLGGSLKVEGAFSTINSRLIIGLKMIKRLGFSLVGKKVHEQGNSPDGYVKDYTFVDNSYIRIALYFGLILFVLIMVYLTYFMVQRVKRKDYLTVSVMVLILLNSIIAHHLVDFSYNIFFFAVFANLDTANPTDKKAMKIENSDVR